MKKHSVVWMSVTVLAVGLFLSGCQPRMQEVSFLKLPPETRPDWLLERDHIGVMAAYSVVFRGWQPFGERGDNIGSVLMDGDGPGAHLVHWARDCRRITRNDTQEADVRVMLGYLAKRQRNPTADKVAPDTRKLAGFTLYTTLESSVQGAGMMMALEVARTVYGQEDPLDGDSFGRLQLDTSAFAGGYPPASWEVSSVGSDLEYRIQLDEEFARYRTEKEAGTLRDFLQTEEARYIFQAAYNEFLDYQAVYVVNDDFLADAKKMVKAVPAIHIPIAPDI